MRQLSCEFTVYTPPFVGLIKYLYISFIYSNNLRFILYNITPQTNYYTEVIAI